MKEVFIVDYGAGNLGSLQNMLIRKCDVDCTIVTDPLLLPEKGDVTPPGVGHFGFAAQGLADLGWSVKLREFDDNERKLLGIYLGAHLCNLVVSDQMTKQEPLEEIQYPMYDDVLKEYFQFAMKKLGFTTSEFCGYIDAPEVPHSHYGLSRSRY